MWFEVVKHLPVNLQLGTSFTGGYAYCIFPAERRLLPWHSRPVKILTQSWKTWNAVFCVGPVYATAAADEMRHSVVVSRPVKLARCLHKPDMVASSYSFLLIMEPKTLCTIRASLQIAKEIIKVAHEQRVYELRTNLSEKKVFIPKCMVIAQIPDRTQLVAVAEPSFLNSEPDTAAAVHKKPSIC